MVLTCEVSLAGMSRIASGVFHVEHRIEWRWAIVVVREVNCAIVTRWEIEEWCV